MRMCCAEDPHEGKQATSSKLTLMWLQHSNATEVDSDSHSVFRINMLFLNRKAFKCFISKHHHHAHGWRELFPLCFCFCLDVSSWLQCIITSAAHICWSSEWVCKISISTSLCLFCLCLCVSVLTCVFYLSAVNIYIYARLVNKLSNLSLCYSDGLGGLGGVWSALQRNPQPGCHGSSGHAASKFLHSKPTLFPVWVSDSVKQDWISTFSFAKC